MRHTGLALVLLASVVTTPASQSSTDQNASAQETQVRGYWIDPVTGRMWAGKDNGKDVSWKGAVKYCRDLRLAGYSDWRLASLAELEGIYDKNANAPGLAGPHDDDPTMWHVKGNVFVTGNEWSISQRLDDRGKPSHYVWFFDFNDGRSDNDPTGWPYGYTFMRALCVRSSPK